MGSGRFLSKRSCPYKKKGNINVLAESVKKELCYRCKTIFFANHTELEQRSLMSKYAFLKGASPARHIYMRSMNGIFHRRDEL